MTSLLVHTSGCDACSSCSACSNQSGPSDCSLDRPRVGEQSGRRKDGRRRAIRPHESDEGEDGECMRARRAWFERGGGYGMGENIDC